VDPIEIEEDLAAEVSAVDEGVGQRTELSLERR
jgi:hypothetical protein